MKLLKFTRYSEWWEYKIVPLLAISYASMQVVQLKLVAIYPVLLFSLFAIIIGAVYVSIINDMTDIKEDQIAGKVNRMALFPPIYRHVIVSCCLLSGLFCGYLIYPDILSLFFYVMAWVAFSCYSIPPVRLKKRGLWGLLCDATGAHLFPTLFIISYLTASSESSLTLWWYVGVGVWSLAYGLRGILWHQFFDRDNDLKSGTKTYASEKDPKNFRLQEVLIIIIELAAFAAIFFRTLNVWTTAALSLYILLVFIRTFAFKYRLCVIITPADAPHQILMNDFYLVFFPLSLLLTVAAAEPYGWVFLICHLMLFPGKTLLVFNDVTFFFKKLVAK